MGTTTATTSIRTGPLTAYSIKGTFAKGTKLAIIGTAGSFYKVNYNGTSGFVSASTVSIVAPMPVTVAKTLYGTTKSSTQVRTGAHINYSVYATMPTGYKMVITGVAGSFYRVTYANKTGYVSGTTVTLTAKPVPTVSTVIVPLYGNHTYGCRNAAEYNAVMAKVQVTQRHEFFLSQLVMLVSF
ncbi:MAG TPA: SH3 domain-containing protein [Clostridium sp.]